MFARMNIHIILDPIRFLPFKVVGWVGRSLDIEPVSSPGFPHSLPVYQHCVIYEFCACAAERHSAVLVAQV